MSNKISELGKEGAEDNRGTHPLLAGTVETSKTELRGYRREYVIAQIQTTTLVNKLQEHVANPDATPLTDTQIRAAKILLDRTLPTLQAAEITHLDENDRLSEGEIVAKLDALIASKPELLDVLLARRAALAKPVMPADQGESNGDTVQERT